MIKLKINNHGLIEVSQDKLDGSINVDVMDRYGDMEYFYTIAPEDMVMLLNYYQHQTDQGKPIF